MKYTAIIILVLVTVISAFSQETKTGRIEVVGPASIDFGKYPAREKKIAIYKIRNAGNDVLRIINVRKTCGCASAKCSKQELKPKEEAEVEVVILSNSIFGQYNKNTFVESSDRKKRFLSLGVAGNAVPLVQILPKDIFNAGRLPTGAKWVQFFELNPTVPGVTLGTPVVTNNYKVETVLVQDPSGNNNNYRLDITLLPTDASGDFNCSVNIPVLTPTNYPPLKITISGKLGTELVAIPGTIHLPVSTESIQRSFVLRLLSTVSTPLDPSTLKVPERNDLSYDVKQDTNGKDLVVVITFSAEFTKILFTEGNLPLSFAVPNTASAIINCQSTKQ